MSWIAAGLAAAWHTANTVVLGASRRLLIEDPGCFDGVTTIGVDEHIWWHPRHGGKYVAVIIELAPVWEGTGPSRLLDMVKGRPEAAFKAWPENRPQRWWKGIAVVAMDGFTGFKNATAQALDVKLSAVMDHHVARLAGDALDDRGRRIQRETFGRPDGKTTRSTGPAALSTRTRASWLTNSSSRSTHCLPTTGMRNSRQRTGPTSG